MLYNGQDPLLILCHISAKDLFNFLTKLYVDLFLVMEISTISYVHIYILIHLYQLFLLSRFTSRSSLCQLFLRSTFTPRSSLYQLFGVPTSTSRSSLCQLFPCAANWLSCKSDRTQTWKYLNPFCQSM